MAAKIELDPSKVHILQQGDELYHNPPSEFLLRDKIRQDSRISPAKPPEEARPHGSHSFVMLDLGKGSVMTVESKKEITCA